MNLNTYLKNLKKARAVLILIIGVTVALALVLSVIQPFKYRATVQMLVIQKQSASMDAYTAVKSAEKVAQNLSEVMQTSSFLDKVLSSNYRLTDNFSVDPLKRHKQWTETIATDVIPDTGIINISVYQKERNQAINYADAIVSVLENSGAEYHGAGSNIEIKNIEAPLSPSYPVRPNVPLNLTLGLMFGLIVAGGYVYLYGNKIITNDELLITNKKEAGIKKQESRIENQELACLRRQGIKNKIVVESENSNLDFAEVPVFAPQGRAMTGEPVYAEAENEVPIRTMEEDRNLVGKL